MFEKIVMLIMITIRDIVVDEQLNFLGFIWQITILLFKPIKEQLSTYLCKSILR